MPYCRKCNRELQDTAKFCPYCGEAITQDITSEEGMDSIPETVSPPSAKTTVWQRLPLWAKILPFVLIVLIAFAPVIVNSISNAVEEAEQKAAEEAFMDGRQAIWAEYATRWNSYADQGETAPTKGTQYPFQPVEGYQDAVAFGSGQVSVDLDANYYAPNILGTVTYTSNSDYLETDVYALCYIFAGEEHAAPLVQSFSEYMSSHVAEGVSSIRVNLANTNTGAFDPSLEFDYKYHEFLKPDNGAFGLRTENTIEDFVENFNSLIVEGDGNVELEGLSTSDFSYVGANQWGYETYCCRDSVLGVGRTFTLWLNGPYIVASSFAFDGKTLDYAAFPVQVAFLSYMGFVPQSALGMTEAIYNNLMTLTSGEVRCAFSKGLIFDPGYDDNAHPLFRFIASTESAYNQFKNGTLSANSSDNNQVTSNPEQAATEQTMSSGQSLPYVIRATEEMPIYSGPGVNYDYNGSLSPSTYTIVEESGGQGANLWGKLKSGAGWIALDHVQLRDSGDDVLETTTNDPSSSSPSSSSASIDTFTFEPTPSFSSTPSPSLSTPEPTPAQPTVETIQPEQNQTGYDEDVSFSQLWKNSSYTQKMWPGCTMSKVSEDDCTPASDRKAITPYDFTHLGQGSDFVRFEVLEKWSGNRTGRLVFSCSSKEWTEDTAKELYGELISMLRQTSANGFKDDNDTLMNDFANAYSRWASDTQFSLEIVVTYQPGKAAGLYFYFNGHG